MINCGGGGDCGWRCIGLLHAVRNRLAQEEALKQVETLAGQLRKVTLTELKRDTAWQDHWGPDINPCKIKDAGTSPSNG